MVTVKNKKIGRRSGSFGKKLRSLVIECFDGLIDALDRLDRLVEALNHFLEGLKRQNMLLDFKKKMYQLLDNY